MPLYEYQCDSCGARFERIQKFSDPPVTVCPTCGQPVRKLLSSPAIQFKGTGWYITDYAKSGQAPSKPSSNGEGAAKTESGAETAAKTESPKPAAETKSEPAKTSTPSKT
jgi:putative FmdB family regulatory protein